MQDTTATSKAIFLPSETWGDNIYDSISDTALRFLASTFILSTNLEALSTQAPFFYETIYPCHRTIWNLSRSFDPHKSVLDFHNAPEIFPNCSQDLTRPEPPVITPKPNNSFFIRPISLVILYMGGCLCAFVFYIYSYNGRILQ